MGIVRKASAISAGALAIALGGGLPLAASPVRALDCTSGGGLVSGITGNVCSLVDGAGRLTDGVTDVADGVTGGAAQPLTKAVDDVVSTTTGVAGTAVDGVGETVDKAAHTTTGAVDTTAGTAVGAATGGSRGGSPATPVATPGVQKLTDGLGRSVQDTCLPLVAGERCGSRDGAEGGEGAGKSRPDGEKQPRRPEASLTPEGGLPAEPYRPRLVAAHDDTHGDTRDSDPGSVNPDEDGVIPLLWPGQKIPELPGLGDGAAGAPAHTHRSYDAAGTALTAALLLSAVLATRVVAARRARAGQQEPRESIPFEGGMRLPGRSGRHRLA